MSKLPFKQMSVMDTATAGRIATFTRPRADEETILINTGAAGDFHLDAGTLKLIGELLHFSPSIKYIQHIQ